MKRLILLAAVLVAIAIPLFSQQAATKAPDVRQVIGVPQGQPLSGDALTQKTHDVALLIRCPVCQGLSIGESPSSMASNMREQARDLLAQGYTAEQVMDYFEKSYGELVRLEPPARGVNWLVWLAPALALFAGVAIVWQSTRKLRQTPVAEDAAAAASSIEPPADPRLAEYLERVRQLAYGEKKTSKSIKADA